MAGTVGEERLPPGALAGCGPQLLRNFRYPGRQIEEVLTGDEIGRLELVIKRISDHLCGLGVKHTIGRSVWRDRDDPDWVLARVKVRMDGDLETVRGPLADSIYDMADTALSGEDRDKIYFSMDVLR